jgi:hypothetical protein
MLRPGRFWVSEARSVIPAFESWSELTTEML